MKVIENYNDYILNVLLESVKNDTLMLFISDNLRNRLKSINNLIADEIIKISNKSYYSEEYNKYLITLLDVNDMYDTNGNKILDSISFYQSNKVIQKIASEYNIDIKKDTELSVAAKKIIYEIINIRGFEHMRGVTKSETSLGRIVKKLFGDKFKDHEIGIFVEKYKSLDVFNEKRFKLVKGDDIVYWYNHKRYVDNNGTLDNSCMKYDRCSEYINFYAKNEDKVSLLILKDDEDEDKIVGRALVWKLDKIGGVEAENIYFMDRIYYTKDYIKELFIKYATNKSWLYKKYQNMDIETPIINSKTNKEYKFVSITDINDNDTYPYMDTFKYYDGNILTNDVNLIDKKNGKKLEDIYGEYNNIGYYIEYYDNWIDVENDDSYIWCEWIHDYRYEDDCYYSDYYDVDIPYDYANNIMINCSEYCDDEDDAYRLHEDVFYSNYYRSYIPKDFKNSMVICYYFNYTDDNDKYRLKEDVIEIDGKNSTIDYAKEHFKYDSEKDEWFKDGVWSEYYNKYINKDVAVSVIVNKETGEKDWRYDDDKTWYYDDDKHKYYANKFIYNKKNNKKND